MKTSWIRVILPTNTFQFTFHSIIITNVQKLNSNFSHFSKAHFQISLYCRSFKNQMDLTPYYKNKK